MPLWTEISLLVEDGELAEAAAEVLSRHLPDGVFIQATGLVFDRDSEGHGTGPYRVCGYLTEGAEGTAVRSRIEHDLYFLGRIRSLPEPEYRTIQELNWVDSWKQHYRPLRLGRRLAIVPAWEENPHPDTIAIRIDPGMAFGTGTHPSTQMSLELMESAFEVDAPLRMIDIGCGSGVLAIAAVLMGAQEVLAVDIDEDAMDNARLNFQLNGVESRITLGMGSVAEVLAGQYPFRQASLVAANILAHILVRLLGEGLADLLLPGGRLVLSGILKEREAEVHDAAEHQGLKLLDRREVGDWAALAYGK